jgi:hypothetical protein
MPIALYAASTRSCGETGAAQTVLTPIPSPIIAAESSATASGRCLSIELLLIRAPAAFGAPEQAFSKINISEIAGQARFLIISAGAVIANHLT